MFCLTWVHGLCFEICGCNHDKMSGQSGWSITRYCFLWDVQLGRYRRSLFWYEKGELKPSDAFIFDCPSDILALSTSCTVVDRTSAFRVLCRNVRYVMVRCMCWVDRIRIIHFYLIWFYLFRKRMSSTCDSQFVVFAKSTLRTVVDSGRFLHVYFFCRWVVDYMWLVDVLRLSAMRSGWEIKGLVSVAFTARHSQKTQSANASHNIHSRLVRNTDNISVYRWYISLSVFVAHQFRRP